MARKELGLTPKSAAQMLANLMAEYAKLDPVRQRVLQVAALAYLVKTERYYYGFNLLGDYAGSNFQHNLLEQLSKDNQGKTVKKNEYSLILFTLCKQGFLSSEYELSKDLVFPLCKLALQAENIHASLGLIVNETHYAALPKFNGWDKFELYNENTLSQGDMRCLNIAIHNNDSKLFSEVWLAHEQLEIVTIFRYLFAAVNVDSEWLNSRLLSFQQILCVTKLSIDLGFAVAYEPERQKWINFLQSLPVGADNLQLPLVTAQIQQLYLTYGLHHKIISSLDENDWAQHLLVAKAALISGDNPSGLKFLEASIREFSRDLDRNLWYFLPDAVILYFIALIREQKLAKVNSSIIKRWEKLPQMRRLVCALVGLSALAGDNLNLAKYSLQGLTTYFLNVPAVTAQSLLEYALYAWLNYLVNPAEVNWSTLRHYASLCAEFYAPLAGVIFSELLLQNDPDNSFAQEQLMAVPYAGLNLLNLIQTKAEWEYSVDRLANILASPNTTQEPLAKTERRLVWLVDPLEPEVSILEQQLKKNGEWSSGKIMPLSRLAARLDLAYISSQDTQALTALEPDQWRKNSYVWNMGKLVRSLVGHPLVYTSKPPRLPLEFYAETPELQVKTTKDGYVLRLSHHVTEAGINFKKISTNKFQVIEFDQQFVDLSQVIKVGLKLPKIAKERLLQVVCRSNPSLKISTDIVDESLVTLAANCVCHIQLTPNGSGLIMNLLIRPFGDNGGYYFPEQGLESQIISALNGQAQKLVRNFKLEAEAVSHLIAECSILQIARIGAFEWEYVDPDSALELLSALENYKQQYALVLEWPKGEAFKFKGNVTAQDLKIQIKSQQQWFEYSGEVKINADEVLNLKVLLELIAAQNSSRFIQLDDGQFIALTESLRRQLVELQLISQGNKVFNLGSNVLAELSTQAAEAKVDKKWQQQQQALKARKLFQPQVPNTLQAELRDYQVEGYTYLSRLSNWQIGACLADDMGLGKTIQAIALLLEQAQAGPSLVVAPTSVCFNWISELNKFAPSLQVYLLHNESQREQLIQQLGSGEVLICSYTLLQYSSELVNSKEWNLLILDEAQNIKNHTTKRFKAACELTAKARVALSGTPIENHVGELWSLFRFLNPGLLGSLESFNRKFVNPISNNNAQMAKNTLKNLIRPYILRRNKTEVLSELPAKIEQAIFIEPSSAELAFYEAIRQQAVERLAALSPDENKRFSILAEITRLRQACCHSSLVDAAIDLENSKLMAFLEIVQDLIANKHKVLVFSQYVAYLKIVQQLLDSNQITYQYIDGSTTLQQRKQNVAAFQNGSGGEVFLISLKAGGTGLNLTAADYVIILDPWWNPAVEDQAADRAHRMGQERPVTVYRLIMKNSIEEKIIQLHKDKRDLAGELLAGQEVSGKLSEADLIQLLSN